MCCRCPTKRVSHFGKRKSGQESRDIQRCQTQLDPQVVTDSALEAAQRQVISGSSQFELPKLLSCAALLGHSSRRQIRQGMATEGAGEQPRADAAYTYLGTQHLQSTAHDLVPLADYQLELDRNCAADTTTSTPPADAATGTPPAAPLVTQGTARETSLPAHHSPSAADMQARLRATYATTPNAKRRRCSNATAPSGLAALPAISPTTFTDLPDHLQTILFSYGAAPFLTCKNAAAVRQDPKMTARWLISHPDIDSPLREAADLELWDVCHVLVDSQQFDRGNYDHSYALYHAAAAGQAGLVQKLIEQGAWVEQLWSQESVELEGCECYFYCDSCGCRHMSEPSSHCRYAPALHTLREMDVHPLLAAADNNHPAVCSLLLQQSIHVVVAQLCVHRTALQGHLAALQVLVEQAPLGTSSSWMPGNPMFLAAAQGHKEIVEFFITLGADLYNTPGTPWSGGEDLASCLVQAASGGNLELVQLLLHKGMSLEEDWQEVLELAVHEGDLKMVRLLLDSAQAAVMEQPQQLTKQHNDVSGSKRSLPGWAQLWDALSLAAGEGHVGLLLLLLHSGMDITQQALQSALTRAAGSGRLEVVQLLFQYGADINDGASAFSSVGPLGAALKGKHWAMAEALLMRGAHAGFDALMHALQWTVSSRVVQLLLQRGVRDTDGRAIFRAAQAGQQDVVELLLDNDEQSVLSRRIMATRLEAAVCGAAMGNHLELLQFLLEPPARFLPGPANATGRQILKQVLNKGLGAAVQGRLYRWAPAAQDTVFQHLPFGQQRAAVVAFLLKQGGDPNYEDGNLLLLAVQQHQQPVLEELLRAGGNKIDLALGVAAGSGHAATVSLLLSATKGPVDATGAALLSAASARHTNISGALLQRDANAAAALHTAAVTNNVTAAFTILSFPVSRVTRALRQELVNLAVRSGSADLHSLVGLL